MVSGCAVHSFAWREIRTTLLPSAPKPKLRILKAFRPSAAPPQQSVLAWTSARLGRAWSAAAVVRGPGVGGGSWVPCRWMQRMPAPSLPNSNQALLQGRAAMTAWGAEWGCCLRGYLGKMGRSLHLTQTFARLPQATPPHRLHVGCAQRLSPKPQVHVPQLGTGSRSKSVLGTAVDPAGGWQHCK